jgi:ankyrin repeat protein
MKLLLKNGADFAITNENGWTPLNAVTGNSYLKVVKLLLEKKTDFTVTDKND